MAVNQEMMQWRTNLGISHAPIVDIELNVIENLLAGLLGVSEALGDDAGCQDGVALLEVGEDHAVGEALATNTDAFQHTVTGQLVHDQVSVHHTRRLHFVGDDATDKVRMGGL